MTVLTRRPYVEGYLYNEIERYRDFAWTVFYTVQETWEAEGRVAFRDFCPVSLLIAVRELLNQLRAEYRRAHPTRNDFNWFRKVDPYQLARDHAFDTELWVLYRKEQDRCGCIAS